MHIDELMPERRAVIVGFCAVSSTTMTGCLNAVSSGLGEEGISLSEEKRAIVDRYEKAIEDFNTGTNGWNNGIALFNDSEYREAVDEFETAIERLDEASSEFTEAEQECLSIGENDAARLCADAAERSALMTDASTAGRNAAQAAVEDEGASTINDQIRTAQNKKEEATKIELREPSVLATNLTGE